MAVVKKINKFLTKILEIKIYPWYQTILFRDLNKTGFD